MQFKKDIGLAISGLSLLVSCATTPKIEYLGYRIESEETYRILNIYAYHLSGINEDIINVPDEWRERAYRSADINNDGIITEDEAIDLFKIINKEKKMIETFEKIPRILNIPKDAIIAKLGTEI